jgi:DNA-binding NarL/FixJ family response regulator
MNGRLTSAVLIGRERELAALLEAATGPPSVVLVEGEAGVGKTRLVQELLARPELRARRRYVGGCQQLSEPFPLGPVVEALRQARIAPHRLNPVAGALAPLLPELADRLPAPPDPLGDRRADRHRLFRALRELLGALGPSILVLEDLHWADDATIELLRFVTPDLPPELTLVGTYRGQERPDAPSLAGLTARLPNGLHVPLQPLAREHTRELARTILDTEAVTDEFADYLLERSGGLPFAVEELLELMRDRSDLFQRHGVWIRRALRDISVPHALRDSILERLQRLDPRAQSAIRAAAVLGTPAPEQLVLDVAGLSGTSGDSALADALASGLLVEASAGRWRLRHVLAQDAVEAAIPSPVRRRLHGRAATALEGARPRPVARLARHYREAGDTARFVRYAEAASDRARSLEDDAMAFRFLAEAVAVPDVAASTRGRLAVKLATHAQHCLAHEPAIAILRRVLADAALPPRPRGEIRLWVARLLTHRGEREAAQCETELALEDLGGHPALAAQAMSQLALPWATEGPMQERLVWLDRASAAVARSESRATRIAVAADRAASLLYVGDPSGLRAVADIPAPGPADGEIRQAMRACANVAEALLHLGHYARAEEQVREGLRLRDELSHSIEFYSHRLTELQLRWARGRWERLDERARQVFEQWHDWAALRTDAHAVFGLLLLARGEVQAAVRVLEPLAAEFRGGGPVLSWVTGGLARIRLAQGRTEAALEYGGQGLAFVRRRGVWVWAVDVAPVTVEALLAADRRTDARRLVREFAAGLRGRDAPAAVAALAVCRAALAEAEGERSRAARAYSTAERAWRALPHPYAAAQAREGAGRCLLAAGADGGRERLVEAMDAFRGLGAAWDAARVRRTLRAHGIAPPTRSGRRSYGNELSPRQAQVARLAGRGLSNREIAGELYLSPKTVEHYLSAAMRKLDIPSRAGLTGRLEQG